MKTIIGPFRIKAVEPLRMTTRAKRIAVLDTADWNLFRIRAEDILIDLLTDSGISFRLIRSAPPSASCSSTST